MSNIDDIEPEVFPEVARGSRKIAAVAFVAFVVVLATHVAAVAALVLR